MALSTIVLDRDGVINHDSDAYIKSPEEWQPIDGSLAAIANLKNAGFRVVVASNQSGIGRGLFTFSDLEAIHDKMSRHLESHKATIDGIFFCPHRPEDQCDCRKPRPGLLIQIMKRWDILPENCLLIGDSSRDIEAARAVNMRAVGVKSGKPIDTASPQWAGIKIFDNLASVTNSILRNQFEQSHRNHT